MDADRPRWIAWKLAGGFAVVLAGPALLLWSTVRPEPWTAQNLRVRFESARYEAVSLVFTYNIENRTRRTAYLAPDTTHIRVRQSSGGPPVGYAFVHLPLELAAHSSKTVEVKLDLPVGNPSSGWMAMSEDKMSPELIPNPEPPKPVPPSEPASLDSIVSRSLENLDGFELVNDSTGLRLIFPRGW